MTMTRRTRSKLVEEAVEVADDCPHCGTDCSESRVETSWIVDAELWRRGESEGTVVSLDPLGHEEVDVPDTVAVAGFYCPECGTSLVIS